MIHFIVHGKNDTVGVAVVDLEEGQELKGWNMETDQTVQATASEEILLGHKLALVEIPEQKKVVKYNVRIGHATRDIQQGQHVHKHNLRTARW